MLEKIGAAAYHLNLPDHSLVHPVFHVSQLKQHVPSNIPVFSTLPCPPVLDAAEVVPEEILDWRLVKKGNAAQVQVLIKWSALPVDHATWEDYDVVKARFPSATDWGQAVSSAGERPKIS